MHQYKQMDCETLKTPLLPPMSPTMHCKMYVALCEGSTAIGWTAVFEQDYKAGSGNKPMKGGRGKEYKTLSNYFHQHCQYRVRSRQLIADRTGLRTLVLEIQSLIMS